MKKIHLLLSILVLITIQSCKNDVSEHGDHDEAIGLFVRNNGETVVEYRAPNEPIGGISVDQNNETDLLTVTFIAKDGDEFTPTETEFNLGFELSDSSIFEMIQRSDDGKWRFRVKGLKSGTANVVLKLNHNDHADFRSKPIAISVSDLAAKTTISTK